MPKKLIPGEPICTGNMEDIAIAGVRIEFENVNARPEIIDKCIMSDTTNDDDDYGPHTRFIKMTFMVFNSDVVILIERTAEWGCGREYAESTELVEVRRIIVRMDEPDVYGIMALVNSDGVLMKKQVVEFQETERDVYQTIKIRRNPDKHGDMYQVMLK